MLRFFHTFAFAEKIKSMATNANIKLAILDFDGTIANTQTLIVDTILGVIEELSLPKLTREQCVAMIGLPLEKTFSTLIPMNEPTLRQGLRTHILRKKHARGCVALPACLPNAPSAPYARNGSHHCVEPSQMVAHGVCAAV